MPDTRPDTRTVPARMTTEEFLAWPFPDDEQWELIEGRPAMSPSPTEPHQDVSLEIGLGLDGLDPDRAIGKPLAAPMDVVLPDGSVVQPDLMLIDWDTPGIGGNRIEGVPLLVVEILSQRSERDEVEKFALYQRAGVPEYWIVDPHEPGLTVYRLDDSGRYDKQPADADGFTLSPTFNRRIRMTFDGRRRRLQIAGE